jgi:hypothetical protein
MLEGVYVSCLLLLGFVLYCILQEAEKKIEMLIARLELPQSTKKHQKSSHFDRKYLYGRKKANWGYYILAQPKLVDKEVEVTSIGDLTERLNSTTTTNLHTRSSEAASFSVPNNNIQIEMKQKKTIKFFKVDNWNPIEKHEKVSKPKTFFKVDDNINTITGNSLHRMADEKDDKEKEPKKFFKIG